MGVPESPGKPFDISKRDVWEAWLKVKENQGAPGVDGQSIADFHKDLKNNLYKVWNRMSSGSYFPSPVRAVEIEKPHGEGMRTLGIPTVADRIAQPVVAKHLDERVEPVFHPDSYGYRPGRSAHDAVQTARRRCWQYDWVIDLDIRSFFDTVPREHVLAAVAAHTDAAWVLLYVKRWLAAPLQHPDGTRIEPERGTPQGSPVSPVLANLFGPYALGHYALDVWLARAINPIVAGPMAYYGRCYRSKLSALLARINAYLVRWIRNTYRRLDRTRAAHAKLAELAASQPRLFRHWAWVTSAWR